MMAEPTARDRVWKFALSRAVRNRKPVKPAEIAEIANVSERMARDCLLVMADSGWLHRRTKTDGRVEYICAPGVFVDEDKNLELMGVE